MKKKILVIEDDASIRRGIVDALSFSGYEPVEAANGNDGMRMATRVGYDLLLLDLVLPGPDGLQILAEVRTARPTMPVIILTARGEEKDRVKGLQLGADDYVVKPFSIRELLARVGAVLRRSPERSLDVKSVDFPGGTADLQRREITYTRGGRCELTEREAEVLRYLAGNPGRAVSRDEILRRVWRLEPGSVETRAIDMQVARLREKLRDDGADPAIIATVRNKGYMFCARKARA